MRGLENIERLSEKYETKLGQESSSDAYELSEAGTQRLMLAGHSTEMLR